MARSIQLIGPSGLTLSLKLRLQGGGTVLTVSLTEDSEVKGLYAGDLVGVTTAGSYYAYVLSGTTVMGSFEKVTITGVDGEEAWCRDRVDPSELVTEATEDGAYACTWTVTDGTDPLQGAKIRFTEKNGSHSIIKTTDANGQASMSLDEKTWEVSITKDGYTHSPEDHIVTSSSSTHVASFAMSTGSQVPVPSDPNLTTGVLHLVNEDGTNAVGQKASMKIIDGPGTAGYSYDNETWEVTSDANGDCIFGSLTTGLIRGATYELTRGTSKRISVEVTVPTGVDSFSLNEVIGKP